MIWDRSNIYEQLRAENPDFTYENFSFTVVNSKLRLEFDFNISGKYFFKPFHIIPLPKNFDEEILKDSLFRNIIFNLGMAELISYWKAACPQQLIIKPFALSNEQLIFWKKLYLFGLGEFFYVNGITPADDFMEIVSSGQEYVQKSPVSVTNKGKLLVPLGGGKDSVVTLEMLLKNRECIPYIMNPRKASLETACIAGYSAEEILTSERHIDKNLLTLNDKGYLNGHTPFSAVLAFTTLLLAYLHGIPEIALSNESSANEPTIPGTTINHQYSKSLEFENDFRDYLKTFITDDIQYYSFLRPLNELQIAKLFSSFPNYFKGFRSCNVGSKTDAWCGECPKCLFTFIILSPFLSHELLISIFGKDLFEDENMIGQLDQLTGHSDEKPFECVGTITEVNAAVINYIMKHPNEQLPLLMKHYKMVYKENKYNDADIQFLLQEFGDHNIPGPNDVMLLKSALDVG